MGQQVLDRHVVGDQRQVVAEQRPGGACRARASRARRGHHHQRGQALGAARGRELGLDRVGDPVRPVGEPVRRADLGLARRGRRGPRRRTPVRVATSSTASWSDSIRGTYQRAARRTLPESPDLSRGCDARRRPTGRVGPAEDRQLVRVGTTRVTAGAEQRRGWPSSSATSSSLRDRQGGDLVLQLEDPAYALDADAAGGERRRSRGAARCRGGCSDDRRRRCGRA